MVIASFRGRLQWRRGRPSLQAFSFLETSQPMVVGTPYGEAGDGSALVYLDGVTKATASVRIAHESLLAATREVARDKMQGIASAPPADTVLRLPNVPVPSGTSAVSAWTSWIDSYGTPSSVATICGKTVLCPWPWLCDPVNTVTEPVGWKRTSPDS